MPSEASAPGLHAPPSPSFPIRARGLRGRFLGHARARLALLLLLPFLASGCGSEAAPSRASGLQSTYEGEIEAFTGPGVLLVVTWADWASVWKVLEPALEAYQAEAPPGVAFRLVDVDREPDLARSLGAEIVPSVVVVREGAAVEVLANPTSAEEVSKVVAKWLGDR